MEENVFRGRLNRAKQLLTARDFAGVILFPSPNLFYLTGFDEEPAERHLFFIVTETDHAMVAPMMYDEQIVEETYLDQIFAWDDGTDPMTVTAEAFDAVGLSGSDGTVLIDDTMFARFMLDIRASLPNARFALASELLTELRITKDDTEIDALREAARYSDIVSTQIRGLGADVIDMTERELVEEIRSRFDEVGGEGFSFDPIVGSGPNGAKPHHRHGDRTIRSGEPVVLDFGTVVDGYPGDQTRTVVFDGEPPAEFERIHAVVRDAFDAAIQTVEPRVEAQEVDRAAREVIEEAGYGEQFTHRTGHGLGLEVHEEPYIVEGNDRILEAGMVHSVEPGIYLDGQFGSRVEDIVVVTNDGCEQLNESPRTWRPL